MLFFIHLRTRRVVLGGITDHPHNERMQQIARNLTDPFDGPMLGARYLLHDRDAKYTASFDRIVASAGVAPTNLPARAPAASGSAVCSASTITMSPAIAGPATMGYCRPDARNPPTRRDWPEGMP